MNIDNVTNLLDSEKCPLAAEHKPKQILALSALTVTKMKFLFTLSLIFKQ